MADVKALLADPGFGALSPSEQRIALGQFDPAFSRLSDDEYSAVRQRLSFPGMEKLGGVPPRSSKLPSLTSREFRGNLISRDSRVHMTPAQMEKAQPGLSTLGDNSRVEWPTISSMARAAISPITGVLGAPAELYNWAKGGFHPPPMDAGNLTDNPLTQAYQGATAALLPGVSAEGVGGAAKATFKTARGATVGAVKSIPTAKTYWPSTAGAVIGGAIGGPHGAKIGGAVGALPGMVKGAIEGVRAEFPKTTNLNPAVSARLNAPATNIVDPNAPPPPLLENWEPPKPLKPVEPPKKWGAAPPIQGHNPPPEPGIPGGTTKPTPGASPAKPAGTTVQPVTPDPLAEMDWAELNRMAHTNADDLELPGSPAGTRGHDFLKAKAKELGHDSWAEMSEDEIRGVINNLRSWVVAKGVQPIAGAPPPKIGTKQGRNPNGTFTTAIKPVEP